MQAASAVADVDLSQVMASCETSLTGKEEGHFLQQRHLLQISGTRADKEARMAHQISVEIRRLGEKAALKMDHDHRAGIK